MIEDMVQIKIAVEGMKAQIVNAFDANQISTAIQEATEKAVGDFDMGNFIKQTIEGVFSLARENVIIELSEKYGERWANELSICVDRKIGQALKEAQ